MKKFLFVVVIIVLFAIGVGVYVFGSKGESTKIYHIGILSGLSLFDQNIDGFKQKMTELGYIEGKNIVYDIYKTNFEPEKEKQIFKKFVDDKVDLIFTFPTEVSLEARDAISGSNVPLVFGDAFTDGNNLIKSIPEPGGNLTGVRYPGAEVIVKNLEDIHILMPSAKRIYVPYEPSYPATKPVLDSLRPRAKALGLTLVEVPVTNIEELKNDIDKRSKLKDPGVDAIITTANTIIPSPPAIAILASFAIKYKIPYEGPVGPDIPGTVLFENPDNIETGMQSAVLADKIFRGVPAGKIPVVSAEAYLSFNYKVAKALGFPINDSLLSRAKQIVR